MINEEEKESERRENNNEADSKGKRGEEKEGNKIELIEEKKKTVKICQQTQNDKI